MTAKILIVDDQASMCWILAKVLEEAGFETVSASTGKEALMIVAEGNIAVAIVDYRLPDMNGLQLLRQMHALQAHMPAFLITSYGSATLRHEALQAGFAGYFDKPFRNQRLVEAIIKVVT